jgi:hypothetical protein
MTLSKTGFTQLSWIFCIAFVSSIHSLSRAMPAETECHIHGRQGIGLVCIHIAEAMERGQMVGFHWGDDTDTARPDAWCSRCEKDLIALQGASSEQWFLDGQFKIFCAKCWDRAQQVCGGPSQNLMSVAEYDAFVSTCRAELDERQAKLVELAGDSRCEFDLHEGVFTLAGHTFKASVSGSHCLSRGTWLWGWANDSYTDAARRRFAIFQGLQDVTGFRRFADAGCHASAEEAANLTALAVHHVGGVGFWRYVASPDLEVLICLERTSSD